MKRTFLSCLLAALLLAGCANPAAPSTAPSGTVSTEPAQSVVETPSDLFTDRDLSGSYDGNAPVIILSDSGIQGSGVAVSGNTVTITAAGTYILRGQLSDGQIRVEADKQSKIQLVLDGVSIHCGTSAAIYVSQADKVFLTLAPASENLLASSSFADPADSSIDGAVFARTDLTVNGTGSLQVQAPTGHGIVCKDELAITGGQLSIQAGSHGISANDCISLTAAALTVEAGKDGLQAEYTEDAAKGFVYIQSGTLDITAQGDGISASGFLQVDGGSFTVTTGGGSENGKDHADDFMGGPGGMPGGGPGGRPRSGGTDTATDSSKGLKSTGILVINGGSFTMNTADDAFHSNSALTVSGGEMNIKTGDDGFHSDALLLISGGKIAITESYEGLEGLCIQLSGGDVTVTADDDGLNAAGGTDQSGFGPGGRPGQFEASSDSFITITGGSLYIRAGGDGIDSNGNLTITGGTVTIHGPTQGDTSVLDFGGAGTITGGTFIGTGAAGMTQTFDASENQGVVAVQLRGSVMPAGTQVVLRGADGEIIATSPADSFAVVILSCPAIEKGGSYTLQIGDAESTVTAK